MNRYTTALIVGALIAYGFAEAPGTTAIVIYLAMCGALAYRGARIRGAWRRLR